MPSVDFAPSARMGLFWSTVFVYGVAVFVFGGLVVLLLARAWRHVRLLRAARAAMREADAATRTDPARGERPEGHAVLIGVVECDDAKPAVAISIVQEGLEFETKNGWSHRWTETSREVKVARFTLLLDSGVRIRVVPDRRVLLVDKLEKISDRRTSALVRTCKAELVNGERACVAGVLRRERDPGAEGGGYRDVATSLVLRRGKGELMTISTLPLDRRHRMWIGFYSIAASIAITLLVGIHSGFRRFHVLNARGEATTATVTKLDTYETRDKKSVTTHYRVFARAPDGAEIMDETDASAWGLLHEGESVPFVYYAPTHDAQIGTDPGIDFGWAIFLPLVGGIAAACFYFARRSRQVWYEQPKVVHRGKGRLSG